MPTLSLLGSDLSEMDFSYSSSPKNQISSQFPIDSDVQLEDLLEFVRLEDSISH